MDDDGSNHLEYEYAFGMLSSATALLCHPVWGIMLSNFVFFLADIKSDWKS